MNYEKELRKIIDGGPGSGRKPEGGSYSDYQKKLSKASNYIQRTGKDPRLANQKHKTISNNLTKTLKRDLAEMIEEVGSKSMATRILADLYEDKGYKRSEIAKILKTFGR